ncbi:MAG: hypothetical protein K1X94_15950 [Sandaracinaceae bacterium]|nr:hypothetical protein [Sandaracinaceae bacterium]
MRRSLVLFALLTTACGRGEARTGERCERDRDCARGLCVEGVAGPRGTCTVSCAADDECPEGWSCSGVTQSNVVICARGTATPFGR